MMQSNGKVESIQRRMAEIREQMDETVDDLGDKARQLRDWRRYVRRYPGLFIAAGAGLGYLLVPRRRKAWVPDDKTLESLAGRREFIVERRPGVARTLLDTAVTHLGTFALRTAMNYAAQRLGTTPQQVER